MKALKIILKTLVVFIPVILVWIYIAKFPVYYMDGEYSYYTQAKDYRLGKSDLAPCDILILGDSRSKSALLPANLSKTCMSMAEGGSTAVEAYYSLKDYLENVGTPEKVILSVCSFHFTSFDGFWTRNIYFDFLSFDQAMEVLNTAKANGESEALKEAGGDGIWTLLEYKIKSPTKYMSPVVKSFGEDRKTVNTQAYAEMVREHGFKSFVSWWPVSTEYDMQSFDMLKTLDAYYRKTIDLCVENGIEVYSVNAPLISDTYAETEQIWGPFSEYFKSLKEDYPEEEYPLVHIETEFESYDTKYFDDADHLNRSGAEKYTDAFRSKYLREET